MGNDSSRQIVADILVLGTRGVGKTTFMTVLGHVFERSGIFGLGLTAVPGTDTFRYVGEMWHRMTAPLEEREFPPATDPHSSAALLAWDVGLGTRQLFRLSTLDCAGETVYRVFGDAPGDGAQEAESGMAQVSQLRRMAKRAKVLCLFVRPADLDAGHSKHPHASAEQRRQSRETVETLLAVSNGAAGEGKQLLFVLSDSAEWKTEFERKGGPKAWLFDEVPQLARSARAQAAVVLGVSAVCETLEKQGHTNDGTPFSLMVPADNFHSEGLETFILCVGSLATRELNPLGTSLLALQETQLAYSEACQVSSPSRCSDRVDAAKDFAEAAGKFTGIASYFLSANHPGAILRQHTEQFIAQCTLPAQRAAALEQAIENHLRSLAKKSPRPPETWDGFRNSLLAGLNTAPPGGTPYATQDLPEADAWFENAFAKFRDVENSRRRRAMWLVAGIVLCIVPALAFAAARMYSSAKIEKATRLAIEAESMRNYADFWKYAEEANPDDTDFQYAMGECYHFGQGTATNHPEAIHWYRRAAEAGEPKAQSRLGDMYFYGWGIATNYPMAIHWYRLAAEAGEPRAQEELGFIYRVGCGVDSNEEEAQRWYKKAFDGYMAKAKEGDAESQVWIGYKGYSWGMGTEINYDEAVRWLKKATEQEKGWKSWSFLGSVYQRQGDLDNAEKCFEKASSTNLLLEVRATKDAIKAFKDDRYKDAFALVPKADKDNPNLNNWIGYAYLLGLGIAEDDTKAFEYFEKAAEQHFSPAVFNLGLCYENGWGCAIDLKRAEEWMAKAEEMGHEKASAKLASIRQKLSEKKRGGK